MRCARPVVGPPFFSLSLSAGPPRASQGDCFPVPLSSTDQAMPRQPSRTQSTNSSGAKKSGTGSSPSSALVDVDSLPRTTRSWSDSQVPTDYVFSSSLTSLNPAPISSPPGSPKCIPGSSLASVKSNVVTPPATISRALPIHPQPTVDASIGSPTKRAALERTQVVWMFVGDTPSITRTSPTPPPPLLPETRALRRSPVLMHMPNALRPLGHPPVAGPSPLRQSSQARTLEDYDQTNARIRTLHAELLADPRSQPAPRSGLRSSASRTLRSDGGGGVRYLNVPGAATDALMAVRHRAARRCTSATGTGIVDISDSESSQFESDDDGNDGEESEPTPPVPRAGTKTVAEARITLANGQSKGKRRAQRRLLWDLKSVFRRRDRVTPSPILRLGRMLRGCIGSQFALTRSFTIGLQNIIASSPRIPLPYS
ncbi:hypothetical protein GSI_03218 [Ganoderma sinense ZZ0214-1]|uniref:Uncharacterized protein n=1 Tax=Ganoderma sinense ZZ0214-1 TaxID=1077348 RepID=A0A2G8SL00_9APHY|nr:hypothetical protein GSI_03218 [Ganoderma sinense ZZ0214-1]